jgi:hypothetical protein
MEEALTPEQLAAFKAREAYDLALYEYAEKVFEERRQLTGCPNIDSTETAAAGL